MNLKIIMSAIALGRIHEIPPPDLDIWAKSWVRLRAVDRLDAIKILGHLPAPLVKEQPADPEHQLILRGVSDFYQGASLWLWHWENEVNIPALKQSHWRDYEGFALLVEARYKLIRGLFDRDIINKEIFPSATFAWLLTEVCICRSMIENQRSQRRVYVAASTYIQRLGDFTDALESVLAPRPVSGLKEFVTHLDRVFELQASEVARSDRDFDKYYFVPYLTAFRRWNAKCMNTPSLKGFTLRGTPPKRGPKLGQKRKKY
jgi:hypothetical protein